MVVLIVVLLVVITLLTIDNVRMRMQNNNQVPQSQPNNDPVVKNSEADTVIAPLLPDELLDSGIDWNSETVDTPANDQQPE